MTTTAVASRCAASSLGCRAVTAASTCPLSSAIIALAPRCPKRACSQCASVRITHSVNRIDKGPAQQRAHRAEGSLTTRTTMPARTIAEQIAQPEITTPQATAATR
ncbi:hypothetical protein LRC484719_01680 [Mycobacterium riyadhense]